MRCYFTTLASSNGKSDLRKKSHISLFVFLISWVGLASISNAQLTTSGGQTAFQLVQYTLLGSGVQLLGVTSAGGPNSMGTFNGSSSNIGISSGVILTTGSISGPDGPVGPNDLPNAGIDNGSGGDAQLGALIPGNPSTFNATWIEFQFIPQG